MSKSSNWLSRVFQTKDSQLKAMISDNNAETSLMKEEFRVYKDKGAPSKAVIVVALDD